MKIISTILICCVTLLLFNNSPLAQNQDTQKKELVQLTVEQRWQRSSWLLDVMMIAGINQAKSRGNTAKNYAEFLADLYAPGWEGITQPWGMFRAMHRNSQITPGFEMEILKESENAITFRFNRAYKSRFGDDGLSYGVSIKEYEEMLKVFHGAVATHLGFNYNQRLDGDWNVITIRNKKR